MNVLVYEVFDMVGEPMYVLKAQFEMEEDARKFICMKSSGQRKYLMLNNITHEEILIS